MSNYEIIRGDCLKFFFQNKISQKVDLTFLDPPFNQDKEYTSWNDNLPEDEYWQFMQNVCKGVFEITSEGGSIYFMQREKNAEFVLQTIRKTGWSLQNLIIWKKKTSAVPCSNKFGKHYQIIAFATKGNRAKTFNRLRISPPLPPNYKYERENGIYLTDVWDDIRELTSGYFAGDEPIRKENGERFHKQQSPIALLLRIILSSTKIGDTIFDPFSGTGTTLVVAEQLKRNSIGIEIDQENIKQIKCRLKEVNESDNIMRFYKEYIYTENLVDIWKIDPIPFISKKKGEDNLLFKL
ncbi:MAG: modification methylase [Deltaproteobacteria bacterium CG07_land_8_20_14_0_80_38_7]|nr:MAG: modification methylase [Deltaproteobacteria bacterium CG07_land_8_20_14_0_80_38_7]